MTTAQTPDFNTFLFSKKYDWIEKNGKVVEISYARFAQLVEEKTNFAYAIRAGRRYDQDVVFLPTPPGTNGASSMEMENPQEYVASKRREANELYEKFERFVREVRQEYNRLYAPSVPLAGAKKRNARPVPR